MTTISGEYNRLGYVLFDEWGCPLYAAGNSPHDSAAIVTPGTAGSLPLRTIRSYCVQTAKSLSKERNAVLAGVERVEDDWGN